MKKFLMTMMAAFVMTSAAFAQENKEQAKCCEKKCEQKCDKQGKCDKKDMVKFKTERTAKRYNLNEKQAAQLLELNQKYADLMKNYDTDLQKIMTPEQYKQYQEDHQKFGKRGHHGKGHGHKH